MAEKRHRNRQRAVRRNYPSVRSALGLSVIVTILAIFASYYIPGELTSLEVLTPEEKTSDFSFSDFYTMVAADRDELTVDGNVTIIALDGCSRRQMGRVVALADSAGATAIGIDMIFEPPTTETDPMLEAVDTARNVVLPVYLSKAEDGYYTAFRTSYFDDRLTKQHHYGAVNINGSHIGTTTRYFKIEYDSSEGPIPTMSAMLAELHRPGSADHIWERGNEMEMINFVGRSFNIITPDEAETQHHLLKDHIVLMGMMSDHADYHRNPLVKTLPGVMIHAYTIATIVNGQYIDEAPGWLNMLIAALVCVCLVFAGTYCRLTDWGCLLVRVLQTGVLLGALYLGSFAYISRSYNFDFSPTILVTVLGLVIMDIVIGGAAVLDNTRRAIRYQRVKHRRRHTRAVAAVAIVAAPTDSPAVTDTSITDESETQQS